MTSVIDRSVGRLCGCLWCVELSGARCARHRSSSSGSYASVGTFWEWSREWLGGVYIFVDFFGEGGWLVLRTRERYLESDIDRSIDRSRQRQEHHTLTMATPMVVAPTTSVSNGGLAPHGRIDLGELKKKLIMTPNKDATDYWLLLRKFVQAKLTKLELDTFAREALNDNRMSLVVVVC